MSSPDMQRRLLEAIEKNPETTQASLATQLGVAVGSVNWVLKRMTRKGYVKVTQLQRRKLKYFLTPQGLALKARLTSQYMEASLRLYRELRQAARDALTEVNAAGYGAAYLDGNGDAAEIFRLTCLERGVKLMSGSDDTLPVVAVEGTRFVVYWPDGAAQG